MSTHTRGPWTVVQRKGHALSSPLPEIRAGDTSIADIRWNGHNLEHGQANARLIAAAPTSARLLRTVQSYCRTMIEAGLIIREPWMAEVDRLLAEIDG